MTSEVSVTSSFCVECHRNNLIKTFKFPVGSSVRKAREAYLIERGKTLQPLGMNKKDEM